MPIACSNSITRVTKDGDAPSKRHVNYYRDVAATAHAVAQRSNTITDVAKSN